MSVEVLREENRLLREKLRLEKEMRKYFEEKFWEAYQEKQMLAFINKLNNK